MGAARWSALTETFCAAGMGATGSTVAAAVGQLVAGGLGGPPIIGGARCIVCVHGRGREEGGRHLDVAGGAHILADAADAAGPVGWVAATAAARIAPRLHLHPKPPHYR